MILKTIRSSRICTSICVIYIIFCVLLLLGSTMYMIFSDPFFLGKQRETSNCIVSSCSIRRVDITPESRDTECIQFTPTFTIQKDGQITSRVSTCFVFDTECIRFYNQTYIIGSQHVCKYYVSDPSYLLLIDNEKDSILIHIPLIVTIVFIFLMCPCCTICSLYIFCSAVIEEIGDKYTSLP